MMMMMLLMMVMMMTQILVTLKGAIVDLLRQFHWRKGGQWITRGISWTSSQGKMSVT